MKKRYVTYLLLLPLLTSCSFFNNLKNSTGEFKESLVIKEFEYLDQVKPLRSMNSHTEKNIKDGELTTNKDNSYKYTYSRDGNENIIAIQVDVAKTNEENVESGDYFEFNKVVENNKVKYTKTHSRSKSTISITDITEEEFLDTYKVSDTYFTSAMNMYNNDFLDDFNYYLENVKDKESEIKYEFTYVQQKGEWYISMNKIEKDKSTFYRVSYGTFSAEVEKDKYADASFLQFIYKDVKAISNEETTNEVIDAYQFATSLN